MNRYLALFCALFAIPSYAKNNQPLVYFDFEKMNISSHGIYTPTADGKHSMDTIKAEVAARANGIDMITKYLNESCRDINSSALHLQPKFETMFHSQGTEIYADGALKVNLMASYKSVFQFAHPSDLKTASGDAIVFALPSAIPANALKCGTPALEFTNGTNQKIQVQIIPAHAKSDLSSKEKLIKLVFDEQKQALIVENPQDSLLLKNANFPMDKNRTTFLPVVVYLSASSSHN